MVSINYSSREVNCKIVYYGPGLSGKTTNLQYVHSKVPQNTRGNLISLATEADRTLYFDFLPINIGTINGFAAKFQLYTVPGQVYYNATRKLVLRGVDGVVFVADSQPDKMEENIESLANLEENLREYGYDMATLPVAIQYNKRDLPGVLPVSELNGRLNPSGWPYFEASATIGNGVFDTLKHIIKLVLSKAKDAGAGRAPASAAAPRPAPAPAAEPPRPAAAAEPVAPAPAAEPPRPAAEPATPVQAPAAVATAPPPVPEPTPAPPEPTPPAPQVESPTAARPFPGDRTGGIEATDVKPAETPAQAEVRRPAPQAEAPANEPPSSELNAPAMAPSLKRRPKKRGFFKRLFGIK